MTSESSEQDDLNNASPPAPIIGKSLLWVAAVVLAVPALVPILVVVAPGFAPFIAPIDTSDTGMLVFLIGLSAVLLLVNWGFLFAVYRWINRYGR